MLEWKQKQFWKWHETMNKMGGRPFFGCDFDILKNRPIPRGLASAGGGPAAAANQMPGPPHCVEFTQTRCWRPSSSCEVCYQKIARNGGDAIKKWHNEWSPSRVSSLLTFSAASQPSLYTYPVYRTHLCNCFQKIARNGGDLPKKACKRMSPL